MKLLTIINVLCAIIVCVSGLLWSRKANDEPKREDPEVHMTQEEIIRHWGFPVEKHDIHTQDGYILGTFRIPHARYLRRAPNRPRPVVLFLHGLDASSACFISNLPENDAAYVFADEGLDVWLGNFRGNKYSRRHVTRSPDSKDFWQFGWDEMAEKDLPAMIDYILNVTNSEFLYYVGHSMGTTTAFALLSTNQHYARKVRRFYTLGPVTSGHNVQGASKAVLKFVLKTSALSQFSRGEFMSTTLVMKGLVKLSCHHRTVAAHVCSKFIFLTEGEETGHLNITRLPVFMAHIPAGTSLRTVTHFGQMFKSGQFRKYDFGTPAKNREHYGQAHDTPPSYDISRMETPVAIFWGGKDYLAPPVDVRDIIAKLKKRVIIMNTFLEGYNHVDFIWGKNATGDVYAPILGDIMKDFGISLRSSS